MDSGSEFDFDYAFNSGGSFNDFGDDDDLFRNEIYREVFGWDDTDHLMIHYGTHLEQEEDEFGSGAGSGDDGRHNLDEELHGGVDVEYERDDGGFEYDGEHEAEIYGEDEYYVETLLRIPAASSLLRAVPYQLATDGEEDEGDLVPHRLGENQGSSMSRQVQGHGRRPFQLNADDDDEPIRLDADDNVPFHLDADDVDDESIRLDADDDEPIRLDADDDDDDEYDDVPFRLHAVDIDVPFQLDADDDDDDVPFRLHAVDIDVPFQLDADDDDDDVPFRLHAVDIDAPFGLEAENHVPFRLEADDGVPFHLDADDHVSFQLQADIARGTVRAGEVRQQLVSELERVSALQGGRSGVDVNGYGEVEAVNNQLREENFEASSSKELRIEGDESDQGGIDGWSCPICMDPWTNGGEHIACCLPCGHLYGMSCIKNWLQLHVPAKCPQCYVGCKLEDARRVYLPHIAVVDDGLQEKIMLLEAKCASLELREAEWCRKEAEWFQMEADLRQQLNEQKGEKSMRLMETF